MQFLHSGPLGDLVFSLPAVNALGGGVFYSHANYAAFMRPLLSLQSYIQDVCTYTEYPPRRGRRRRTIRLDGESLLLNSTAHGELVNFDIFKPRKDRQKWYSAELYCDIVKELPDYSPINVEEPWLTGVTPDPKAKIIVTCTPNYHIGEPINWSLLADYADDALFLGLSRDYAYFTATHKIKLPHVRCSTALEIARIILGSKLFVGNQSGNYAIAEALKHPRVLEVCTAAPVAGPRGPNASTTLTKEMLDACVSA